MVPVAIGHVEDEIADNERRRNRGRTRVGSDAVKLPHFASVRDAQRPELAVRGNDNAALAGEISDGRRLPFTHARGFAVRLAECSQLAPGFRIECEANGFVRCVLHGRVTHAVTEPEDEFSIHAEREKVVALLARGQPAPPQVARQRS